MGVSVAERPRPSERSAVVVDHVPAGVVLWDDPNQLTGGWASVAGAPPERVRGPEELPSQAMWITNADWKAFTARGCGAMHHMRTSNFIAAGDVRHIVADLGLAARIDATNSHALVPIVASVLDRAMRMAGTSYPWDAERPFVGRSLHEDIARVLRVAHKHPPQLQKAIASAYQEMSGVTLPWLDDSLHVTLKRSRVEYARRLLSLPLPSESWEYLPAAALPARAPDRLAWVVENDRPVLAEVSVSFDRTTEEMARLVAFGILPYSQMPHRSYACQQEIYWLSRFAQIDVRSAHVASAYGALPQAQALPPPLAADPLLALSYSAGLVADAHLRALMDPAAPRGGRAAAATERQISLRALWLRAYDRAEMFAHALAAYRAGLAVRSYGRGELMVRIAREDFPRLISFALAQGFFLPVWQNLMTVTGFDAASLPEPGHE